MSDAPDISDTAVTATCDNCGAEYRPPAAVCWLCHHRLPGAVSQQDAASRQDAEPHPAERFTPTFSIAGIMLLTTLCAVVFGVFMMAPGLAVLLVILSVPAFVRTGLAVFHRTQRGAAISSVEKAFWFVSSLTVTTVIATLVVLASIGTFCAVCLGGAAALNDPNTPVPFALLAAGVATAVVLVLSFRWVRYRWRRDVGA